MRRRRRAISVAGFGKEFEKAIQGGPTAAAKTVRVRNGKPLATDGAFTETKEQLDTTRWRQPMQTMRSALQLKLTGAPRIAKCDRS
jgi:hypothetical protein